MWLLLSALWLMNAFDLGFTLHASSHGLLVESNPVAIALLAYGPAVLILFKVGLVGFSSWVFVNYRHRLLVEGVVWLAVTAYVLVSFRWMYCYEIYQVIVAHRFHPPLLLPV